jgi:hypothetical protein
MLHSDSTLDIISGNLTAGCNGTDAILGATGAIPTNFTADLKLYYPVVRDLMCLKKYANLVHIQR